MHMTLCNVFKCYTVNSYVCKNTYSSNSYVWSRSRIHASSDFANLGRPNSDIDGIRMFLWDDGRYAVFFAVWGAKSNAISAS